MTAVYPFFTASLIAEPAQGRLHVSRGNPCQAAYAVYQLD